MGPRGPSQWVQGGPSQWVHGVLVNGSEGSKNPVWGVQGVENLEISDLAKISRFWGKKVGSEGSKFKNSLIWPKREKRGGLNRLVDGDSENRDEGVRDRKGAKSRQKVASEKQKCPKRGQNRASRGKKGSKSGQIEPQAGFRSVGASFTLRSF